MFQSCSSLTTFNTNLKSLTGTYLMFGFCSNLTTFESDLTSLTDASSGMFLDCENLKTFNADLSSLERCNQMFAGCKSLRSFTTNLSSLSNAEGMFFGCNLNKKIVEDVLTMIPEWNDGKTHKLDMHIARHSVETFNNIVGNPLNIPVATSKKDTDLIVSYKGWTIGVSIYNPNV